MWMRALRLIAVAGLLLTGFATPVRAADPVEAPLRVSSAQPAQALPVADRIVVRKAQRELVLLKAGEVLRSYRVALGLNPVGPKLHEGDFRTPEGSYRLVRRNPRSDFFLSMQVSYPNADDQRRATGKGLRPGGSIMIHGLPNSPRHPPEFYDNNDWTDGCIAVSNGDMVEIWLLTPDDVPIDILP